MPVSRAAEKYLLIANVFPPIVGGSATVYESLCRVAGGEVAVLTGQRDYRSDILHPDLAAVDGAADYPIVRIDLVRPLMANPASEPGPFLPRLASDVRLIVRVLLRLRALIRQHRYRAVIIGELVYGGWIGLAVKYLFRRPYVIFVHGEELTTSAKSLSERSKGFYLRRANGVVAVSRFTAALLADEYSVFPRRIAYIPNGVDSARFRFQPPRTDLLERYGLVGKKVFLTVGRLVPRKGVDTTLRALPRVLEGETQAHYVIVGDGPIRDDLEDLAATLGVYRSVTFCGQVDDSDLVDHYALGRIFVMPNRQTSDGDTEGFGLVFLEANACGLPVIAGRAGGTGDAVTDGENGLVVDGDNVDSVAAAILRLLGDENLAAKLRRNGLARAQGADWSSRWQELSAFLEHISERKNVDA